MEYEFIEINLENTSEELLSQTARFLNYLNQYLDPSDPLEPDEIVIRNMRVQLKNPQMTIFPYVLRDNNQVIALALYAWFSSDSANYEENKHLSMVQIQIHPEYRRQGLATWILEQFYPKIKDAGKEIIISSTEEEDGLKFNEIVGGVEALANIENRLYLSDIDWEMCKTWVNEGKKRSPDTKIIYFETVPEEIIDHFAEVYTETTNQVPMGELDIKQRTTSNEIRIQEQQRAAQDKVNWYAITQEPDGEISGMTWLMYNAHKEIRLSQGLTSVREHHRGRGLGKWLKADMLLKVQEKYPKAQYIITHNATTNAPMLSINNRLGFKEYRKAYNLQIKTSQLGEYLEKQKSYSKII